MEVFIIFLYFLMFFENVLGNRSVHKYYMQFRNAFDKDLYTSVLDENKCSIQLKILTNHTLGLRFIDATGKLPSGILEGNLNELGDYFECLAINQVINEMNIQGKFCALQIPLKQELIANSQSPAWTDMASWFPRRSLTADDSLDLYRANFTDTFDNLMKYFNYVTGLGKVFNSSELQSHSFPAYNMTLGVCIPHACTAQQVMDYFLTKYVPILNLTYSEYFCRLPNDKPVTVADYVAVVVFFILGVLTIVSSSYDVYNVVILKRDQSQINKLYKIFSVYTNTKRLVTFHNDPKALECVDGIRAISMLWVVIGHSYWTLVFGGIQNTKYVVEWSRLFTSTWLTAAPLTVDTFFFLSGMLSVYVSLGKFSRDRFVKNIPFYYLLRLLRMFPLLAAMILIQISFLHHASDGPFWIKVATCTASCKKFWWSALLHIQNFVNPIETCISPTWYLSVDTQLYILSPLVLIWMFGRAYVAWIALSVVLVLSLIASSYYSFTYDLSVLFGNPDRVDEIEDYVKIYYMNTAVRASPYFVGMAFGYLMHLYRDKCLNISRVKIGILWAQALFLLTFCVVSIYPTMQKDNGLQLYENFLNSYMRALWACGLGWVLFACVKGYGGPVNWFLSLQMWKLPARISYGIYLVHFPLILITHGGWTKTQYFSDYDGTYRFISDATLSFIFSFFLTILIDSPFSVLQKLFLTGKAKPQAAQTNKEPEKMNGEKQFYKTSL